MAETADVRSIDALRDLRAALVRFIDDAKGGLNDVDFDIRRTLDWVQNGQRLHWQGEIKRWEQKLSQAKAELHRKKLSAFQGRKPDTSQEEKAVKYAESRVEEGHAKLKLLKRRLPELQHAVQQYRGRSQPLADMLEGDVVKAIARLDRMVDALEAYLSLRAPSGAGPGARGAGAESMARPGPEAAASAPAVPEPTATGRDAPGPPQADAPGGPADER